MNLARPWTAKPVESLPDIGKDSLALTNAGINHRNPHGNVAGRAGMAKPISIGWRRLPLILAALAGSASCGKSATGVVAPLKLERTIELHNTSGRIDHMAIDLTHHRLFVAEVGNGTVDVIDLARDLVVGRITGLKEPQGLAWLPDREELAVANGGDGTVRFYRGSDLAASGVMPFGDDADNLRVDPRNDHLVLGYGAGALAVIDTASRSVLQRVKLPGHPEGFRLFGDKAIVNIPDARRVLAVNLASGMVEASWRAKYRLNFPMAVDRNTAALVFRWPARLVLMNIPTGTVTTDISTCGDSDDVFFDSSRQRIIVSCGSGVVQVFGQSSGAYHSMGTTVTRRGARTALFVPELDRLFVAVRASEGQPAEIRIFRPI